MVGSASIVLANAVLAVSVALIWFHAPLLPVLTGAGVGAWLVYRHSPRSS